MPFEHLRNTCSHVKDPFELLVTTAVIVVGINFTTNLVITAIVVLVLVLYFLLSVSS